MLHIRIEHLTNALTTGVSSSYTPVVDATILSAEATVDTTFLDMISLGEARNLRAVLTHLVERLDTLLPSPSSHVTTLSATPTTILETIAPALPGRPPGGL
jgi:hypothetical protein